MRAHSPIIHPRKHARVLQPLLMGVRYPPPHTGLGNIPSKSENSYLHQNTRRQLMRFQLSPKEVVVPGDERVARVRARARASRWHASACASQTLTRGGLSPLLMVKRSRAENRTCSRSAFPEACAHGVRMSTASLDVDL